MTLIELVVIVAIVGALAFFVYKKRDKIKAKIKSVISTGGGGGDPE